jgi:peroxiredoxin
MPERRWRGWVAWVLGCSLAWGATTLQAAVPWDVPATPQGEQQLHQRLHLDPQAQVSYRGPDGESLSFAAFLAQLQQLGQLGMTKSLDGRQITLRASRPLSPEERAKQDKSRQLRVAVGDVLPAPDLPRLDGGRLDQAALRGRYTVLSFFFEACTPCIAEVPALNRFRELHPQLQLLSVTFDNQAGAQRFVERHHLAWPVAYDSRPYNQRLGVNSYPSFVLLDPQGRLLGYTSGIPVPGAEEAAGRQEHQALLAWVKGLVPAEVLR